MSGTPRVSRQMATRADSLGWMVPTETPGRWDPEPVPEGQPDSVFHLESGAADPPQPARRESCIPEATAAGGHQGGIHRPSARTTPPVAGSPKALANGRRRLPDCGMPLQRRLHFGKFDAVSIHLHLIVQASAKLQCAIRPLHHATRSDTRALPAGSDPPESAPPSGPDDSNTPTRRRLRRPAAPLRPLEEPDYPFTHNPVTGAVDGRPIGGSAGPRVLPKVRVP